MAATKPMPPIIIKKKAGHSGHHGGAWKVAYADFVTAMMALFIVLWLMNSSKKIQEAVGGYFKDPKGTAAKLGSEKQLRGQNEAVVKEDMEKLKEELQLAMKQMPDFDKFKDQIEITITKEGLRIELLESEKGTFFDSGSAKISSNGRELLLMLAGEFGKLPNTVAIEGHTDSKPYAEGSNYGNWELSSDRANAARRLLQQHGIRENQVTQVRGFADQRLRKKDNPMDPSNRRISLIVQYLLKSAPDKGDDAMPPAAATADTEKAGGGEIKPEAPEAKPSEH
jgi:chemotaxis protein MotB